MIGWFCGDPYGSGSPAFWRLDREYGSPVHFNPWSGPYILSRELGFLQLKRLVIFQLRQTAVKRPAEQSPVGRRPPPCTGGRFWCKPHLDKLFWCPLQFWPPRNIKSPLLFGIAILFKSDQKSQWYWSSAVLEKLALRGVTPWWNVDIIEAAKNRIFFKVQQVPVSVHQMFKILQQSNQTLDPRVDISTCLKPPGISHPSPATQILGSIPSCQAQFGQGQSEKHHQHDEGAQAERCLQAVARVAAIRSCPAMGYDGAQMGSYWLVHPKRCKLQLLTVDDDLWVRK